MRVSLAQHEKAPLVPRAANRLHRAAHHRNAIARRRIFALLLFLVTVSAGCQRRWPDPGEPIAPAKQHAQIFPMS